MGVKCLHHYPKIPNASSISANLPISRQITKQRPQAVFLIFFL